MWVGAPKDRNQHFMYFMIKNYIQLDGPMRQSKPIVREEPEKKQQFSTLVILLYSQIVVLKSSVGVAGSCRWLPVVADDYRWAAPILRIINSFLLTMSISP